MDPVAEWTAAQERVIALVERLDDEQARTRVPACPDWSVRQLLAHMVGLDADLMAGTAADDHNPGWTQAQVDARADRSITDIVAEWRAMTTDVQQWTAENGAAPLGDVVIHEQDIRGALGEPGARGTDGWVAVRATVVGAFAEKVAGRPTIALVGNPFTFATGDDADCLLVADDFDLARALMGRRSAAQLRSYVQRGDVTPYLDAFTLAGPLPEADLDE